MYDIDCFASLAMTMQSDRNRFSSKPDCLAVEVIILGALDPHGRGEPYDVKNVDYH